jgi:hypothetical protein
MGTNYVKKARTVRLPAVADLQINSFSTGVVDTYGSYIYNGTVLTYPDGTPYVTQRPGMSVFQDPDDASTPVTDDRGRGVFYWSEVSDLYCVNNDTVYKTNYDSALSGAAMDPGTERVEIAELADKIVLVDAENNEMFYIDSSASTTLCSMQAFSASAANDIYIETSDDGINSVSAMDFSEINVGDTITIAGTSNNDGSYTVATVGASEITVEENLTDEGSVGTPIVASVTITSDNYDALPQNNSRTLAHGVAVLDQTMYVLDTAGSIWGSEIADVQDWDDALNVITAEKEEDAGVYIDKHFDNIVVFGRRTIEFFFNNANPAGSPLSSRKDISYNIGCADAKSVWRNGDDIFFLGIDTSGQIRPYMLSSFKLTPLTNSGIISFITTSKSLDEISFMGCGFSSGGVTYYLLTVYTLDDNSDVLPSGTYVYNSNTQYWTQWEFAGTSIDHMALVAYSITDDSRIGEGILAGGELVYVKDNYEPSDQQKDDTDPYISGTGYYVGTDTSYVTGGSDAESDPIVMKIRLDNFDNNSRDWKFAHQLRYVGDPIVQQHAVNLSISWNDSDNNESGYTTARTIDISDDKNKLTRLGRFKSRSFHLEYEDTHQIRIKGLDLDITEGTH